MRGLFIFIEPLRCTNPGQVLLLEKALAKMAGSYATLATGTPLWVWQSLTGNAGSAWTVSDGSRAWPPLGIRSESVR